MSFIINPYRYGASAGSTLNALIMADSPSRYFRHAEASGAVMVNEVGANGSYVASPSLAQPALYTGGGTSFLAASSKYGNWTGTFPAATSLTLVTIAKFNAITGFRGLLSRDAGGGGGTRSWQWRTNGSSLEFVKIVGTVQTVSIAAGLTTGVSYLLAVTVSTTGTVKLFRNGTLLTTASVTAVDYNAGGNLEIGFCTGGGGISANAFFSESAFFSGQELSEARMAAYAAAAGL
jgi:hypothetical protein